MELLLLPVGAVVANAKRANQGRQGEPLEHERGEDHREGEEQDQLALRQRRPGVGLERQRQRRGEETAPRIPLQATTIRNGAPTRRARWLGRRSRARMTYGIVNVHANRIAITVPEINAA